MNAFLSVIHTDNSIFNYLLQDLFLYKQLIIKLFHPNNTNNKCDSCDFVNRNIEWGVFRIF